MPSFADLLVIASEQHGVFTRAQARRCNVSDRILQYRVSRGELVQLARGVYRVGGSPATWHQRVLAACYAGGDECVASHRTAAALHGFDSARTDVVEVTVPRRRRARYDDAVVHQSLDICAGDSTMIGPIPVTTPARTLIDLGVARSWQSVEEAFDGAERDSLTTTDEVGLRHAQIRKRGRRGVGPMAVVLDGRVGKMPHSVIERRFLRLLESASLPAPECQYELRLPNGRTVYLDAAYVVAKLAWELDGHGSHATRRQRASDNVRAAAIEDLGWQLRRFTYEQVMFDGPSVVRAVRSALNARSCDV